MTFTPAKGLGANMVSDLAGVMSRANTQYAADRRAAAHDRLMDKIDVELQDLWYTDPLSRGVIKYTLPSLTVHYTFSFIMSLSVALSLLAQGNNGDQILQILDTLVADIEQEGINSCAEVFEVWLMPTVCSLVDTGGHLC